MLKCWAEEDIHRPLFFDVVQNIEDLKNGMVRIIFVDTCIMLKRHLYNVKATLVQR